MKYAWVLSVIVLGQAYVVPGRAGQVVLKRRHFTPQTVVVAKQKLLEIAHGPRERRRDELRHALEVLLTDYGLEAARTRANDLIEGNYGFLRALPANDRVALAPVVADLIALFPLRGSTGMAERLQPELETLAALANDENPTVAARAQRLIEIARGHGGQGELREGSEQATTSHYWIAIARAFLKRGRAGLIQYIELSKPQVMALKAKQAELDALLQHPNPLVAKRARLLLRVVGGQEVIEYTTETLKRLARGFLSRGVKGLEDYTEIGDDVLGALTEQLPSLEMLTKDENVFVAKRAEVLLKVANGESNMGLAGSTLKALIEAFFAQGKAGLVNGLPPSEGAVAALMEKLPALERLAKDEDATVAERAQWLIRIAHGEPVLGPEGLQMRSLTAAFLAEGRFGLLLGHPLNKKQLVRLGEKLSQLEMLSSDKDPIVAERAQWLVRLVTKREASERSLFTLLKIADSFLKRGRAGLSDYEHKPVSDEQRLRLVKRIPELEMLSRDKTKAVAGRAKTLIRMANDGSESVDKFGPRLADAFLNGDRAGLLAFDGVAEVSRRRLVLALPQLEKFSHDGVAKVANRAAVLIRVANNEPVEDRTIGNVQQLMWAFFKRGRLGLLDYEAVSEKNIELLITRLPELERLANDESESVAKLAKMLIGVANRAESEHGGALLKRVTTAFLSRGRLGLLHFGGPSQSQIKRMAAKMDVLERLSIDEDPVVGAHAKALVSFVKEGAQTEFTPSKLYELARAFLQRGRSGLLVSKLLTEELIAKLRDELPVLEAFAKSEKADVAARAKLLVRIANGEAPTSPSKDKQRQLAHTFLRHGAPGLIDYLPVTSAQIAQLGKRLPELEGLLSDDHPGVVKRVKMLIDAANSVMITGSTVGGMRRTADIFLSKGREGLAAMNKPRN